MARKKKQKQKKGKGRDLVAALLLTIFGVGLVGLGGWVGRDYHSVARFGLAPTAQGVLSTVNEWKTTDDDGYDTTACRVSVTYTAPSGQEHTYSESHKFEPCTYKRGEKVTVYYNPNDPSKFRMRLFFAGFMLPLGVIMLGLGFLGGALNNLRGK